MAQLTGAEIIKRPLAGVKPLDKKAMETAKKRWNSIAKPIGSLGLLEADLVQMAGIRGTADGMFPLKTALAVMCADHGVVAEGVSQTGQEVTRIVAENFTSGKTCTSAMCRISGTDIFPVDMGMLGERGGVLNLEPFRLLDRKIRQGSGNIAREPAMSLKECRSALLSGMELAGDLKDMGYDLLATGEMGIGNTTPTSALSAVLLGISPEEATGRGAGLSDEGLKRKKEAVSMAVARFFAAHPDFNGEKASGEEAVTLLSELGGFDIAGICGLFLGGAVHRLPVVIDGFISAAAALLAVRIFPGTRDFLLASHVSSEPAAKRVMEALSIKAPMDFGMHLGEGSGAVALFPLLTMAAAVYEGMSTFDDIAVKAYEDYEGERT